MRLDIVELSVDSLYVSVWASPYLPLHMGKTENVSTMVEDHFGRQLQVLSLLINSRVLFFFSIGFPF
jgi:hypothetical protein